MQGGGGSPEQSQEVVSGRQFGGNYKQLSARRVRPRSFAQARTLAFIAKGGEAAEPVLSKRSVLADIVKFESGLSRPTESGATHYDPSAWTKSRAFTMAEILLSLTIIGVVAAITLPSLTGNINERTWNTQRKALYARFSQAIALMPALNGYGVSDDTSTTEDKAAETFLTAGLSKVLKINNICDSEHLADCGLPSKVTGTNGTITFNAFPTQLSDLNSLLYGGAYTYPDTGEVASDPNAKLNTKVAAFETQNGESIALFYNPSCRANMQEKVAYSQSKVCANFIYDLNGSKGPNTVGKDIGVITVLYPSDSVVVAPVPTIRDILSVKHNEAGRKCSEADSESRMPNLAELVSIFYNQNLFGLAFEASSCYWTSDLWENGEARALNMSTGYWDTHDRTQSRVVRCVKR